MKTRGIHLARSTFIASLLITGVTWAASPVSTQPGTPLSVAVRLSDLDFNGARGAEAAFHRIAAAAEQVCPPLISSDLQAKSRMRGCVRTAIGESVARINQPALTAYYVTHSDVRSGARMVLATSH